MGNDSWFSNVSKGSALAVGFFVALLGIALVVNVINLDWLYPPAQKEEESGGYALQLPISITVRDKVTGSAITSGTVYILEKEGDLYKTLETVSYSSGWTTGNAYQSGTKLYLWYTASGYMTKIVEYEVPLANTQYQNKYFALIETVQRPDDSHLTLSILDETSSAVATESSQSGASLTNNEVDLYAHIVVGAGYGLINYYDPVEREDDNIILMFKLNDTLATITGLTGATRQEYGDYAYYFLVLDDIVGDPIDPTIVDLSFTVVYSGSGAITLQMYLITETDAGNFGLTADSDGFSDNTVALVIS